MDRLDKLKDALSAVLCDPEGNCCIAGSNGDRLIIDQALSELTAYMESVNNSAEKDARIKEIQSVLDEVVTLVKDCCGCIECSCDDELNSRIKQALKEKDNA